MDNQNLSTYVPVYDYLPEEWDKAKEALVRYLKQISEGVNYRDVGTYYNQEVLAGQRFVPTSNQGDARSVFRKVILIGALPNTTTKQVAHGITVIATTRFTRIYGTANNPSTQFLPIPYVSTTAVANGIEVWVDATYVNIKTGVNYAAYTDSFIVLEWVSES